MARLLVALLLVGAFEGVSSGQVVADEKSADSTVVILVMDPLSKALACDCVQGYAQRDYEKLGVYLAARIKQPVKVVFGESIKKAFKGDENAKVDLIIGKDSVVRFDLKASKRQADLLVQLTDKTGKTTQTGLIVVPNADPALSVIDLANYRILFGPEDSAEKHQAPMKLLTDLEVAKPSKIETCPSCSDGAAKILEVGPDVRAAAVISSYAQPLLEGCGTIQKGDLRVIGETEPVPFISAFVNTNVSKALRDSIEVALLEVGKDAELTKAMETKLGFVKPKQPAKTNRKVTQKVEAAEAKKK